MLLIFRIIPERDFKILLSRVLYLIYAQLKCLFRLNYFNTKVKY